VGNLTGLIRNEWHRHLARAEQAKQYRAEAKERRKVGKKMGAYMGYTPTATWLRRALYNRWGWSLTSQNLNEDRAGRFGAQWRDGRAWLSHWKYKTDERGFNTEVSWRHGRKVTEARLMLYVGSGENGSDLTFAVSVPRLFSWWFSLCDVVRATYRGYEHNERQFGFSVFEDHVSFKWHYHDSGGWYSDKTKNKESNPGFYRSFFWKDVLLGRAAHSKVVLSTEQVLIPLPEGAYPATIVLTRSQWKRPRWPWPRTIVRAEITPEKPVGIPGKGENAWDIDDDAVFSMTTPADTIPEAISEFVKSVLETRRRHGGKAWVPEEVTA
jgi:hypothetical protein